MVCALTPSARSRFGLHRSHPHHITGLAEKSKESYKSAYNKHFKEFVASAHWEHFDECDDIFLVLDEDSHTHRKKWTPNDSTFIRFALHLYKKKVSPSIFKSCMAMCYDRLNTYLGKKGANKVNVGYLFTLNGIKECECLINGDARLAGMTNMTDVQASIEGGISKKNMIDMSRLLWEHKLEGKPDKQGRETFTSELYQYNTLSFLLDTHQVQCRYDDRQAEVFAMCFTRRHEMIGQKGVESLCNLANGGKTNKNHNQHYTAMIGTKNPLVDPGFARGGLYCHRFLGGPK